jgi:hypothetical protein
MGYFFMRKMQPGRLALSLRQAGLDWTTTQFRSIVP